MAYTNRIDTDDDSDAVKKPFEEASAEALEDFALSEAVHEGLETESATRAEVFNLLGKLQTTS